MDATVRRTTAIGAVLAILLVVIVSLSGGGSDKASAAAASPYGELQIFEFQGNQKLVSPIKDHSWNIHLPIDGASIGHAEFSSLSVTRSPSAEFPPNRRGNRQGSPLRQSDG